LQNFKATQFNSNYIGKTVKILVDGSMGNDNTLQTGRTDGNIIVNFPSCGAMPGEFIDIKIDMALNWAIFGQAINK
jgi:tRNA-2-methylthio-N6-dimethylallyladenosine synthase